MKSRKEYGDAAKPGQVLTTAFGYDADGNVNRTTRTDLQTGEVRESTAVYDPLGYPHAVMNALGHVTRTGYDPVSGQLAVSRDANGLRVDYTYDSLGRLVKTRQPSGAETTVALAVEDGGKEFLVRAETTNGTGAVTQSVFDRLGRVRFERFKGFDGKMRERKATYLPEGQLREQTVYGPVGSTASVSKSLFEYDDAGRLIRSTDPTGAVRRLEYSPLVTTEIDARGHRKQSVFNHRGQTVQAVDALGTAAETKRSYAYGSFGTLLSSEVDGEGCGGGIIGTATVLILRS